jgi:hypothetical protein
METCTSCGKEFQSRKGLIYHQGTCQALKDETVSHLQLRHRLRPLTIHRPQPIIPLFDLGQRKRQRVEDTCVTTSSSTAGTFARVCFYILYSIIHEQLITFRTMTWKNVAQLFKK